MEIVAQLKDVKKEYQSGDSMITALDHSNLAIYNQELTLIMGPSGSGKTTLLSLIGCVIYPSAGEVYIQGKRINDLSEKALSQVRLHQIGFVFQHFNLIHPLTALENVMQPLLLQSIGTTEAKRRALAALEKVSMADRAQQLPHKLSGGQKQRVAIARALVTDAPIILCDEPTASLDAKSAALVMAELKALANSGKAVIVVTHDLRLRPFADRMIYVEEGIVSNQIKDEENFK